MGYKPGQQTEMNMLRIFEWKIERKIYVPVNGGECWRTGANQEVKYILQGADIVKFIKFAQLRWYDHVERMQNQQMSNQVATATVEGTTDRERQCKRWRGKFKRI